MQDNQSTTRPIESPSLSPLPPPIRPTLTSPIRRQWNTTPREGWPRQWMGYTKDGNNARVERKESCGQHYFSHWVLRRLHITRDTEENKWRRTHVTPAHFIDSPIILCGKLQESISKNTDFNEFHTGTHLHWKARTSRECCGTEGAKAEDIW